MVTVDQKTGRITLYRGDTGHITIKVKGYDFGPDDRAVFTVRDIRGIPVMRRVYALADNRFVVSFGNKDTKELEPKTYYWDVRYDMHPEYDQGGDLINGESICTPGSSFEFRVLDTVGRI